METINRKHFLKWIWRLSAAGAAGITGLLLARDKRKDPTSTFVYNVDEYRKVDPALVKFREAGRLRPNVGRLSTMAVGPEGDVHVAGSTGLVRFDANGQEKGRFPLQSAPDCMAVALDGEILLGMRTRVVTLNPDGSRKKVWEDLGEKGYITGIAANETEVWVADAGGRVLLRYDRQGALQARIDGKNESNEMSGFVVPSPYFDVAFDPEGALWAVNPGRHGLEQYRASGELVTAWHRPSIEVDGFAGCCNPIHIAFRGDGTLVTLEKGLARVKVYSPDQRLLGVVAPPDLFGVDAPASDCCDIETPLRDLAVDKQNRVLVAHREQDTVFIFEQKETLA